MKTRNLTIFPFGARVTSRKPPQREMTMVVRGKFALAPGHPVAPLGDANDRLAQGFMTAEVFRDDDDARAGECLYPSDFADFKLKTDVLLKGTCHAPNGRPVTECPVRFSVGTWSKSLRVVGRRVWSDSYGGAEMSSPLPFTKMPIDYAHAFGGPGYTLNPSGKGFKTHELPNVELPSAPLRSREDRPEPAGFGPLNPAWPQRSHKVGREYGKAYQEERAPFYSEDFDWTYFNAAPPDQQLPRYLRGDEELTFQNLHPEAQIFSCWLPGLRIRAFVMGVDNRFREVRMNLDTLFADLDEGSLYLTWRGLDAVAEDDLIDVRTVLIASEELADPPRPEIDYREMLAEFERDPLSLAEHTPKGLPDPAEAQKKIAAMQSAAAAITRPDASAAERVKPLLQLLSPPGADSAELQGSVATMLAKAGETAGPHMDLSAALAKAANDVKVAMPPPRPVTPGAMPPLQAPGREAMKSLPSRIAEVVKFAKEHGLPTDDLAKAEAMAADPQLAQLAAEPPAAGGYAGQDLSGRDLRGVDLRGADLSFTNFTGSDLSGALLSSAKLGNAILYEAVLVGADLTGADLTLANLTGAKAASAKLSGALLDKTFLDKADLSGADLSEAKGECTLFQSASLPRAKLGKTRFEQAYFEGADLEQADFAEAILIRCLINRTNAKKANFSGVGLVKTSFGDSDLSGALFVEARGECAIFLRSTLTGADFSWAAMPAAHFTEVKAAGARFFAANLRESRFYRAMLERAELVKANLFAADFNKAVLTRARFTDSNLYDAKFLGAAGEGCDFQGANLKRSTLERA